MFSKSLGNTTVNRIPNRELLFSIQRFVSVNTVIRRWNFLCIFILYTLNCLFLSADLAADEAAINSKGNLILGFAFIPDYIGSDDYEIEPLIISNFSYGNINGVFEGTGTRIDVWDHPFLEAGPVAFLALDRRNVVSEPVNQVGGFGSALELGGYLGFAIPYGGLPEGELSGYVSWRRSLIGDQDGSQFIGLLEYFFAAKRFLRVGMNVNFTAADSDFNRQHFGVTQAASNRSGLPEFRPGGGVRDVAISAYSVLSFSRRWGVFTRVLASRVVGDAARSPLVTEEGSETQLFFGLGVFRNFY